MQPWLQPTQASTSAVRPSRALLHQVGIGDQRARHADGVGVAGGDEPLGRGDVDDRASRRSPARSDRGPHERERRGDRRLGRGRRRRDPARRGDVGGVAERERGEVDQAGGAQRAGDSAHAAASSPSGASSSAASRTPTASPGPAASRTAASTSSAKRRRVATAVGVVAPVRARREELRDQVAVRHRDLDPVDPALAAVAGRRWRSRRSGRAAPAVSARGSLLKRGEGTADGATAGARGAAEICSRPPWKSCTKSRLPCSCTASASCAYPGTMPGRKPPSVWAVSSPVGSTAVASRKIAPTPPRARATW